MVIKKLNAVLSWILTALLIGHIATTLNFLLTGAYDFQVMMKLPRILAVVCILHVCLSIGIVFFMHDGSDLTKYRKLNQRTLVQRASGLMILLLVHPHVRMFESFLYESVPLAPGKKILVFLVEMLSFASIYTHLGCSFSRSLITMGLIRSEKTEHRVDTAAAVLCAAGFALTFFALASFLIKWPSA